jgi:hypothetical protein
MNIQHKPHVLILGPMRPVKEGREAPSSRTLQLTALIHGIAAERAARLGSDAGFRVEGPDANSSADIIPGILTKIERADLVILDLTGGSTGVMYELGLVHALGLPFICLTSDSDRPFYTKSIYCITRFELRNTFDAEKPTHAQLRERIEMFLRTDHGPTDDQIEKVDFAANPVTAFFGALPIVDISAPAGLAAGYWRNAVRRFVGHGGYFEEPDRVVALRLGTEVVQRNLPFRHLIAIKPASGLNAAPDTDFKVLRETLADAGYAVVQGHIQQANPQDMRDFGVNLLGRVNPSGAVEVVDPGIVLDIPTTLYALQYSPRILRIDSLSGIGGDRAVTERLRHRRYDHMIDRFAAILAFYLRNADNKGHIDQVHFVEIGLLPDLLERLVRR